MSDYVLNQQKAGADVIQLFDTWAGELSTKEFNRFAGTYIKKIIDNARLYTPFIIYCRQCRHILNELADTGAEVVSIDPDTPIEEAIDKIGDRASIQGNIDPKILLTTHDSRHTTSNKTSLLSFHLKQSTLI